MTIPVTANISGTYDNSTVSTDLSSGVSILTKQLIEIEKQKLLNTGKDKLDGVLNKNKTTIDSNEVETQTKKDSSKTKTEETVKGILNDLFNNRKKKKETVN